MRSLMLSYILCAAGLFSPFAGIHRFYWGKSTSGVFYLLTWGFFGIGTVMDLIRMPSLVDNINIKFLLANSTKQTFSNPERAILKCANANHGVVTTQMVTLTTGLDLKKAKLELDRLYKEGFCHKDVDEDGSEIFQFNGLSPKKPLI